MISFFFPSISSASCLLNIAQFPPENRIKLVETHSDGKLFFLTNSSDPGERLQWKGAEDRNELGADPQRPIKPLASLILTMLLPGLQQAA